MMSKKVPFDKNLFCWRCTAIVYCICWIIQFFYAFYFAEHRTFPYILIPQVNYVLISLSFIFSILLIIKPFFFYVYTFELGVWGLLAIADGYIIDGLLIMVITACFALKAGSFRKNKRLESSLLFISIFLSYLSLWRFGKTLFIEYTIEFMGYFLIILFIFKILSIEYNKLISEKRKKIVISGIHFSELEKLYIQKIIDGVPYKIIESEYKINISNVKKTAVKLCKELKVSNKSELLCRYGEYLIVFS